MGDIQSSHSRGGEGEDTLKVLEEEVKKWNDYLPNLKESWQKGDRSWIYSYLKHQMDETETRWLNVKSTILSFKEFGGKELHIGTMDEVRSGCQTTLSKEEYKKSSEENTPKRVSEEGAKRTKQNETLEERFNLLKKHNETLKVHQETFKEEINLLQKRNEISTKQKEKLEARVNQLQNEIDMLKAHNEKLEAKVHTHESRIYTDNENAEALKARADTFLKRKEDMINAQKKKLEDHISKHQCKMGILMAEVNKLKIQRDRFQEQNASLEADVNQRRKQIDMLKQQNQQLQSYKNQLQAEQHSRLPRSNYAVDSNHATSNRDDRSLPIQMTTWYAEIYRNEWQDAYEQLLKSNYTEEEAIEVLKLVLQDVVEFCKNDIRPFIQKTARGLRSIFEQYRKSETFAMILQAKFNPKGEATAESYGMVPGRKKEAKYIHNKQEDTLEEIGVALAIFAQQHFQRTALGIEDIPDLKPFILKCLHLGWMMAMQNPPAVFHEHHTDVDIDFDKDLYKEYKTSGPLIKFVVWPALFLHENGPLLAHGFAEGKKCLDLC